MIATLASSTPGILRHLRSSSALPFISYYTSYSLVLAGCGEVIGGGVANGAEATGGGVVGGVEATGGGLAGGGEAAGGGCGQIIG
ncbi:hypothetical protein L2E82_15380 [Cichorium intybus]|uniref:Uncharacterized protein n=1 Tax=Cichorium intybus TaxID=13427 RepID=A0ACB9F3J4_CICIN|nr:hypothetical protein L2E82_15380 [Cichorium intybus]